MLCELLQRLKSKIFLLLVLAVQHLVFFFFLAEAAFSILDNRQYVTCSAALALVGFGELS